MSSAGKKSSIIRGDRRQITTTFDNGDEQVEEFDVVTDELVLRKTRTRTTLGGLTDWVIEVGTETASRNVDRDLIIESSGSPVVVRQESKEKYIIRIRNLPYPREVFLVTVEHQDGDAIGEIVVRTTNKKYFKRVQLPAMNRANIPLDAAHLSVEVKHQTLIIEYTKHLAILAAEAAERKERASMPSKRTDDGNEGCQQQ